MHKDRVIESLESMQRFMIEIVGAAIISEVQKKKPLSQFKGHKETRSGLAERFRKQSKLWFDEIRSNLDKMAIPGLDLEYMDERIKIILRDALFNFLQMENAAQAAVELLMLLNQKILVDVYTFQEKKASIESINAVLELATPDEKDYLGEAHSCAKAGCLRASVVFGWSAAMYRMHKTIEKLGFNQFNDKSGVMKRTNAGRFKKINKEFDISTLSELRATVFDTDMLWVLEGLELIDSNQHKRLQHCYTMRSTSAHPGEAIITLENLESFFSDLRSIVFDSPSFSV